MASNAQFIANQLNAQQSTGPQTAAGKARTSTNAVKLGLFSLRDFVRPGEAADYQLLTASLWNELAPVTVLEQTFATQIIRATWRLNRCTAIEADYIDLAANNTVNKTDNNDQPRILDPIADETLAPIQKSVDRARAQATNSLHRAMSELRRLKAERPAPEENSTAPKSEPTPPKSTPPPTKQTHSPIPRNSLCPCNSGQKYKRCCGKGTPPVLNIDGHPEVCTCNPPCAAFTHSNASTGTAS